MIPMTMRRWREVILVIEDLSRGGQSVRCLDLEAEFAFGWPGSFCGGNAVILHDRIEVAGSATADVDAGCRHGRACSR